MSILQTVLIYVGIPLAIYLVIAGLSFLGKPLPGKKPEHFELGAQWTQPPVLWSATDEVTGAGHHDAHGASHGNHAAIDSAEADLIGGRASGKF